MKTKLILTRMYENFNKRFIPLVIILALLALTVVVRKELFSHKMDKTFDKIQEQYTIIEQANADIKTYNRLLVELERTNAINHRFPNQTSPRGYSTDKKESLLRFLDDKVGMPYKLGGKGGANIDCSGLFGAYAFYISEQITYNTLINHFSAQVIYNQTDTLGIEHVKPGDFVFWKNSNGEVRHIAIAMSNNIYDGNLSIIDASPEHGVSARELELSYSYHKNIYHMWGGNKYTLEVGRNFLLTPEEEVNTDDMEDLGTRWVSSYIPGNGDNINCGGESCAYTASGLPLKDEYAGEVVACPKQYAFGTKFYIEGHGEVVCKDRGGLITTAGEVNSRGNVARDSHLDIFGGMGTAKISWSARHVKVYLIK